MPYLKSREITSTALLAALWGILNSIFSPIFFRMTGLPFLCDLIGFAVLSLTVWWIRKLGAPSIVGIIATVINFIFNPGGLHFLGFTVASIVFDLITCIIGYDRIFRSAFATALSMIGTSIVSAAVAGLIIGTFFMTGPALARWGGVLSWAGLHAVGGVIGGAVGVIIISALRIRGISAAEKK